MLSQVTDGVLTHQSELLRNNTVVVEGSDGILLVDAGIQDSEMVCLARDLRDLGLTVAVGFSTHPDWDHALWHPDLGEAPRYGTTGCAEELRRLLCEPDWRARVAEGLPPEIADDVPLDLFGLVTALPAGTVEIPWDGPRVQIVEHPAHAEGHAALVVPEHGVLVAGDMLSDVLVPFPDLGAADPLEDYLTGLQTLEELAGDVATVVPGHGSVGDADELHARIALDRAYVLALRDGRLPDDPRLSPAATFAEWLPAICDWQLQQLGPGPADDR